MQIQDRVLSMLWSQPCIRAFALLVATTAVANAQITATTSDNFSSGKSNWANGKNLNNVQLITAGGPAGAGDAYLQVVSSGQEGPGGRPIVFNRQQWTGNYSAAGVQAIAMDLINQGDSPLDMRVALRSSVADEAPSYVTTSAIQIPNDKLWHHAVFPLTEDAMTVQFDEAGPFLFSDLMQNVAELRVLHNSEIEAESVPFATTFGIDNVQAIVPEPAMGVLSLIGSLCLIANRRRAT